MTPTTNIDPVQQEETLRNWLRIAGWWERAETTEHWPLTTDEAASLLHDAIGYRIDVAGLNDLLERRLLAAPGVDENGAHEWIATDVCTAAQLLEDREQWLPIPSGHDHKKHPFQIALENARSKNIVGMLVESGGPIYDVAGLLPALVKCDSLDGRRQIVALLKAVLESEHGIIV